MQVPTLDKDRAVSVPPCSLYFGGTLIHGETSVFEEVAFHGKKANRKQRKNHGMKASESLHYPVQFLFLFHNSFAFLHLFLFFFKSMFQKSLMWVFFFKFSSLKAYSAKYGKPQF